MSIAKPDYTHLTADGVLRLAINALGQVSQTPRLDAELIVMAVSRLSREQLIMHAQEPLNNEQHRCVRALVERRLAGEPIAYLVGKREFWSMELLVSPAALIPRPETEVLVEQALRRIPPRGEQTVADMGTGCGAVALALARERPHCRVIATDKAASALALARKNAERLNVTNIEFRLGHWAAPLAGEIVDVAVSNPPYVPTDDPCLNTGEASFEPLAARAGGPDGLDAIRELVKDAGTCLRIGTWLLLEHGHDQAQRVRTLMQSYGFTKTRSYSDFAGLERVTRSQLTKKL